MIQWWIFIVWCHLDKRFYVPDLFSEDTFSSGNDVETYSPRKACQIQWAVLKTEGRKNRRDYIFCTAFPCKTAWNFYTILQCVIATNKYYMEGSSRVWKVIVQPKVSNILPFFLLGKLHLAMKSLFFKGIGARHSRSDCKKVQVPSVCQQINST